MNDNGGRADGSTPLAAGWYPDPSGRPVLRWWDGSSWTKDLSANGRTFREPTPTEAIEQLSREPQIVYVEREPKVHGGHTDLLGADGRLIGWAVRVPSRAASGEVVQDAAVGLFDATGQKLGTVLTARGNGTGPRHQVFDPTGVPIGAFRSQTLSTILLIETGAGPVARVNFSRADTYLAGSNGQPLAHLRRSSSFELFAAVADTYWLEPMAPMPTWLFVLALFTPIEVNMRKDAARAAAHNAGNMY